MITTDINIFLGLDVGKTDHWSWAVTNDGTKNWNKTLPNDNAKFIAVHQKLTVQGTMLVVVDKPASIGALAVAFDQNLGIPVAYLPGLSMRRIADIYPGTAKTDVLTELPKSIRENSSRSRGSSTRFCSHGQLRERPATFGRFGSTPVRGADYYR